MAQVTDEARRELQELINELFAGDLRRELANLADATDRRLAGLEQRLAQLPAHLRPLQALPELQGTLQGLGKAVMERFDETERRQAGALGALDTGFTQVAAAVDLAREQVSQEAGEGLADLAGQLATVRQELGTVLAALDAGRVRQRRLAWAGAGLFVVLAALLGAVLYKVFLG